MILLNQAKTRARKVAAIFGMSVFLLAHIASAEWTVYDKSEDGTVEYCIDLSTIKNISNDVVRVWVKANFLVDLSSRIHAKEWKMYQEIVCSESKYKTIQVKSLLYSGEVGSPDVNDKWSYAAPDERISMVIFYACKKQSK